MTSQCIYRLYLVRYTLPDDTVFFYGPAPSPDSTVAWEYRYHVVAPGDPVAFDYAGLAWTYVSDQPYLDICQEPDAACFTPDLPGDDGEGF